MAEYRPGVLIHNFNEDRFGHDLVGQGKQTFSTPLSTAQRTLRDPREMKAELQATGSYIEEKEKLPMEKNLDAYLLFGHAGDMSTTENLKTKCYIASSQYFLQHPHKITNPVTPENFYQSQEAIELGRTTKSHLVQAVKAGWNWDKNGFKTTNAELMSKEPITAGLETQRQPRVKGEFTKASELAVTTR